VLCLPASNKAVLLTTSAVQRQVHIVGNHVFGMARASQTAVELVQPAKSRHFAVLVGHTKRGLLTQECAR
jgi:hypothetical protein